LRFSFNFVFLAAAEEDVLVVFGENIDRRACSGEGVTGVFDFFLQLLIVGVVLLLLFEEKEGEPARGESLLLEKAALKEATLFFVVSFFAFVNNFGGGDGDGDDDDFVLIV